jgi:hypothetical protein
VGHAVLCRAVLVGMKLAGLMVSRGFAVMFGCGFMMMGSLMMMVGAFVCHGYLSWKK